MRISFAARPTDARAALLPPALSRRGLVVGAAGGAALVATGCGSEAEETPEQRGFARSDLEVVNYALGLEYLEAAYYERVVESGVLSGREANLARGILANERAHVLALESTAKDLGGPVAKPPRVDFSDVIAGGRDSVIEVAADLEGTGAGAYLAEADRLISERILSSALSIHTVEARHAAILNLLAGRPPLPDGAFAVPVERGEVERRISRFLV